MANETFRTKRPRELSDFVMGIPAVMCVVTLVPLLFYVTRRESSLEYVYRQDAKTAFAESDHKMAVICFDRLVRLRPNDADRLQLATWLRETGQIARSNTIMRSLAPEDERGYGPAHLWFAKKIINTEGVDTESMAIAINHLKHARDTLREGGEVDYLLATCYWSTGSPREAVEALSEASARNPKYFYDLFKACQRVGFLPGASTAAKLAKDHFKPIVAEEPLNRDARIKCVETQLWLKEYKEAESLLIQAAKLDPEGKWNEMLSNAYLAQFRQTKSEGLALSDLLSFLEKSLAANPESPDALKELTDLGVKDANDRIEQILENVLTTGRHSALVHFVLGSRKLQAKEPDTAAGLFHMKRAFELDKNLVFAANNLAYHESVKDDGDVDSGLELITNVLERFPDSHAFRETRGQLYTRLGQYEDALSDLEFALAMYPGEQRLHESLAKCYRELGQGSLANRHAERARRIAEREPTRAPKVQIPKESSETD